MNEHNHFRLDELPPEHPLRQQPFSAPDGYFDSLPSRVQARVAQRSKPAFSISWSWQRTAASLAGASLIALLVWQTLPQRQESLGNEALAGVSDEMILAYLDDQGVDPYELASTEEIHAALGSDTTAVDYLNLRPAELEKVIDEQNLSEPVNTGS